MADFGVSCYSKCEIMPSWASVDLSLEACSPVISSDRNPEVEFFPAEHVYGG